MRLVTPQRQVLDTDVDEVYAPGVLGQFGVLPGHITFLTALSVGELRYREAGRDHFVAVSGGFAEVSNDVLTVLADTAELPEEIDSTRARAAEQRARADLGKITPGTPEHEDMQSALSRALNRVAVSGRSRS